MDVSVIIVNYRVKYFLEQTLLSVQEALEGVSGEIVVVDNHSGDDSMEFIKARFPHVVTIENKRNVGFSRANNMGIKKAQGRYTLILNPDTIIGKNTVSDCIAWMDSHSDCGAIGVKMLDGNGNFLPESKRSLPTPWVSFCKIFGLSALMPHSRLFARYRLLYLSKDKPHRVDILSGAFIFAKSEALKAVGGFDKDFFMYGEDIDLSYRLTKQGYSNYYVPTTIIHYKGESTKKDSIKYVRIFYQAMIIFFNKHYPNYSGIASFLIRAGVWTRASLSALNRIVSRLIGSRKRLRHPGTPATCCVVSHAGDEVARRAVQSGLAQAEAIKHVSGSEIDILLRNSSNVDVIWDNRDFSYAEIIERIERYCRSDVRFHIYSGENDIIISPKMNLP